MRSAWMMALGVLQMMSVSTAAQPAARSHWIDQLVAGEQRVEPAEERLQLIRQSAGGLQRGRAVGGTPITIGGRTFAHGLGTHATSDIVLWSPEPIIRFEAWVGVDTNEGTAGEHGSVVFAVYSTQRNLYQSEVLRGGGAPVHVDLTLDRTQYLHLRVGDAWDGISFDHANWADATITLASGRVVYLDDIDEGPIPAWVEPRPFSFVYNGRRSRDVLASWSRHVEQGPKQHGRQRTVTTWDAPDDRLRVILEVTRFPAFGAAEWLLHFENVGEADTAILERIEAMDFSVASPFDPSIPYRLHRTGGAPSNLNDFAVQRVDIKAGQTQTLGAEHGRSSNEDLPFFKVETGIGSIIAAVGWSGNWQAAVACSDSNVLRLCAGLREPHFRLRPGERVRMPRILLLHHAGDTWESNARFRQLIYRHYAARRAGELPLPILFCNTCFMDRGGWLGDLNTAANQIDAIKAYAKLGIEAVITDAGWMEGSQGAWWRGCGNWHAVRKDNYPEGIGPVARAARDVGIIYGLWHEIETVVHGTRLHREHPDWLIDIGVTTLGQDHAALLNFGHPDVPAWAAGMVTDRMTANPGLAVYRQDFGLIQPTPHWQAVDAPDRRGITEIKHVCGLYDYWERIARERPDALLEECAAGGRRIDLETVMRMHIHQKTDFWFNNENDQRSLWALSQYLPNNCVVAHLDRLDDTSFHSTLASSLCVGWKVNDPGFDRRRAQDLVNRYKQVRHLLVGAWYPLTAYSRNHREWLVSQYHRDDLGEGMILAFRGRESPYPQVDVAPRGIDPHGRYQLTFDVAGRDVEMAGEELQKLSIKLVEPGTSELITYRPIVGAP